MKEGDSKLNRRDFLKMAGSAGAGAVLAFDGGFLYKKSRGILEALSDTGVDDAELANAKKFLRDTYGVEVTNGETWNIEVFGGPLSRESEAKVLKAVILEMEKYPQDFFQQNRLKRLHLLKNGERGPFYSTTKFGGLYHHDHPGEFFLTDMKGFFEQVGDTFNHELVHLLDYADGGVDIENRRWIEIQNKCRCGTYGQNSSHALKYEVTDGSFASSYGSGKPTEDRAELGAIMLNPNKHTKLLAVMRELSPEERETLQEKYDDMKAKYLRWSRGRMDEKYWKQLLATAKSAGYTSDSDLGQYFTDYTGPTGQK